MASTDEHYLALHSECQRRIAGCVAQMTSLDLSPAVFPSALWQAAMRLLTDLVDLDSAAGTLGSRSHGAGPYAGSEKDMPDESAISAVRSHLAHMVTKQIAGTPLEEAFPECIVDAALMIIAAAWGVEHAISVCHLQARLFADGVATPLAASGPRQEAGASMAKPVPERTKGRRRKATVEEGARITIHVDGDHPEDGSDAYWAFSIRITHRTREEHRDAVGTGSQKGKELWRTALEDALSGLRDHRPRSVTVQIPLVEGTGIDDVRALIVTAFPDVEDMQTSVVIGRFPLIDPLAHRCDTLLRRAVQRRR